RKCSTTSNYYKGFVIPENIKTADPHSNLCFLGWGASPSEAHDAMDLKRVIHSAMLFTGRNFLSL
ncbi:MAG: hypothetical protein JW795_10085, partial [Chitinivibrionales bacterium]|nr:hypothetical protein [Chitinivibrionales bacterium]